MLLRTALQFTEDEKAILASMLAQNIQDPGAYSEEDINTQKGRVKKRSDFSSGINQSVTAERTLITTKATLALNKETLKQRVYAGTVLGKQEQVKLQMLEKEASITQLLAEIEYRRANIKKGDEATNLQEIENMENSVLLLTKQKLGLKDSIDATKQLGVAATNAFANGLQKGIQGVIEGTMSLKEAFLSMTKSILSAIAQILAKQAALAILGVVMPGASPGGRDGGIMKSPGYRSFGGGGVASGPDSGYAATLHGTEAVVPLPNGKSIPVEMSGGAGANNVSVNVNMTTGQSSSTGDGEQAYALGRAISTAVQTELEKQQRPGGALSPY